MSGEKTCAVEDCKRPTKGRGWCADHYMRWWRTGHPLRGAGRRFRPADWAARFWDRVDRWDPDWCWEWTGPQNGHGYGRLAKGSKHHGAPEVAAHRLAYELCVGPIAEELTLDHLCRNKVCVNPKHLEPVTREENTRRSRAHSARQSA